MSDPTSRLWFHRLTGRAQKETPLSLQQSAGKAPSRRHARHTSSAAIEVLESRIMLAGDHPSFADFPNATPINDLDFDALGRASRAGVISTASDDDVFRFRAPAGANFISILADTVNASPASSLNSRVRVYDAQGNQLTRNGVPIDGTNNGILSTTRPGVATDGWLNFIATPGEFYFVQVSGEGGTTGAYIMRINAGATDVVPNDNLDDAAQHTAGEIFIPAGPDRDQPPPNGFGAEVPLPGPGNPNRQEIEFPQDERIYRVTLPNDPMYDSLATATARADRTNDMPVGGFLDTHLEIYDADGNLLGSDLETGYLNDAFVTWRVRPGQTYYIRVRGDDLRDPNFFPSVGAFQLRLDFSAKEFQISEITRRGDLVSTGMANDPEPPAGITPHTNFLLVNADSGLFRFKAQGTGTSYITVRGVGHDVTVRVYNSEGTQIAFNDDFFPTHPTDAQVAVRLIGGETYFVVVDGFDDNLSGWFSGEFNVWVEAHHTLDPNVPVDDHANRPSDTTATDERRRAFEQATPLRFGDATPAFDIWGNPIPDRGHIATAIHTGRIHNGSDSDLFSFVAPVDMLSTYAGNNDDVGAALFAGGNFNTADPRATFPRTTGPISLWDADDWWFVGKQGEHLGFEFGFFDNPATPDTDGPEIYVMREVDFDGDGPAVPGLVVGGDFILRSPVFDVNNRLVGIVEATNLAIWQFNTAIDIQRYHWFPLGDPDGAVRAMVEYDPVSFDPDGNGPAETIPDPGPNLLVLGGDFNNIGGVPADKLAVTNGFVFAQLGAGLGAGPSGSVRALAVYDPEDPGDERPANPGPPNLPLVADTPDQPISLIIGGRSNTGAILRTWNGVNFGNLTSGTPEPDFTIVGNSIDALIVYDPPDIDGDGPIEDDGPFLYIAGDFESIGGVTSRNLIQWGRKADPERGDANADPEQPNYQPRLLYEAVRQNPNNPASPAGTNGPVRALAVWDPPDVFGDGDNELFPVLVLGGEFTTAGGTPVNNVAHWGGATGIFAGFIPVGGGVNGPVHALTVSRTLGGQLDDQEPSIFPLNDSLDPQEVLYVGGEFTLQGSENIAQYQFVPGLGFTLLGMRSGLGNEDGSPSAVFALAFFDDQNPQFDNSDLEWDRHDRPGSRLEITVNPTADSFLNVAIRVYDSNFNLVYPRNAAEPFNVDPEDPDGGGPLEDPPPYNTTTNPLAPDPAGMINPAIAPGTPDAVVGIPLWGGETYYIEVLGDGGTGRYELIVTVDGVPVEFDQDGVFESLNHIYFEVPGAGQWPQAINIDRYLGPGDGRNYISNLFDAHAGRVSLYVYPSTGLGHVSYSELGNIERPDDTDLFSFVAEASGWVEVRIATTDIGGLDPFSGAQGDQYVDDIGADQVPELIENRIYNSRLDSALRIFNADFEEIAYNDNFPGITGEFSAHQTGIFDRVYTERDARVVFRVERGVKYYVQVESGQKPIFEIDPDFVDWRHATGAYELLLNTMPDLAFDDDHADYFGTLDQLFFYPTPIRIGDREPQLLGEPANGEGYASGVIDNTDLNIDDIDSFYFIANTNGVATVRFNVTSGDLTATVTALTAFNTTAAQGVTNANGSLTLTFFVQQGQEYYILVDGAAGEGGYEFTISIPPYTDDHADYYHWPEATELVLSRYFGTFSSSGVLESAGDTDLFVFTAENYEIATVNVSARTAGLNTFVRVYEIGADGLNQPSFLRIAYNDDAGGGTTNSRVSFSVTPGRPYYILVSGADPNADAGSYTVSVSVAPTDDHPDIVDLPVATTVAIAYDQNLGTGSGSATGVIEIPEDEDLFVFTAPTTGDALITVNVADAALAPRVRILDAQGQLIAIQTGSGGTVQLEVNNSLVAGQQYFVLVEAPLDGALNPVAAEYGLTIVTSAQDDYPDAGQFDLADDNPIVLNPNSGFASRSGQILPFNDTDLFFFRTLAAGQVTVEVVTPTSSLDPQVRIFRESDTSTEFRFSRGNNDTVVITFNASAANEGFFILVEPDDNAVSGTLTGAYSVRISAATPGGGGPGGGGPDDHANANDWENASRIVLDARTADGSRTGAITFFGDTDLFVFTTEARGPVRVQVIAADGSGLDAAVKVYDQNQNLIRSDTLGIPGATAYTTFDATAGGQTYYILVEQVGPNIGAYTVLVNASPVVHYLYYPEGFSGATIDEYIPMVNPNDFDVTYTIIARYEVGERDQVLATGTIAANSRGGITVSTKAGENPHNVRIGVPYAIEIQSSGQLGATLSHYDFGVTTGENFTERTSTTWFFSEAHKDAANYRDFLVFYNPNEAATNVTVTLIYDEGSVVSFTRPLEALRRGGVNFNDDLALTKEGVFAVKVESDLPIVAALSSFDLMNGRGYGLLGDPDGGSTEGVIPAISGGSGVESSISIFNPGITTTTVTLRGIYQRADLPDLVQVITIGPGARFSASMTDLGIVDGQVAGVRYTSTAPVILTAVQYRHGDGDATTGSTRAITSGVIGDAFVNPAIAGITYIEELALYNPANIDVNVSITFLFADGSPAGQYVDPGTGASTINIKPDSFGFIRIDQQPAILNRPGLVYFSIRIDAPTPIVATFNHYDLFLNGGWGTAPAPLGFEFPLTRI